MGWSVGFDSEWDRDIGYGVPAYCDHPGCGKKIDRGLGYVCGGEPFGENRGCGLYFCSEHLSDSPQRCERCTPRKKKPFTPTQDHPSWTRRKLRHASWAVWRKHSPEEVARLQSLLKSARKKAKKPKK